MAQKYYTKFDQLVNMYRGHRIFLYIYGKPIKKVRYGKEYEVVGFDSDHKKVLVKDCDTTAEDTWSMQKVNSSEIRYVERRPFGTEIHPLYIK